MKFREITRILEEDGWHLVAQRGSHRQYKHPTKPGKVTVAGHPGADVPRRTAANILRQAWLGGKAMSEYLAVIEREGDAWGAYCPDLPGVGVAGETREEVERLIREAVSFHLTALREAGDPIPEPSAVGTTLVEVPAA
jgi:predicted RNA binding protein YcfA (HicA-like mRNA interferase family)/predicted RNase H-like HicB family nuclease